MQKDEKSVNTSNIKNIAEYLDPKKLLTNIRFYILLFSFLLSFGLYLFFSVTDSLPISVNKALVKNYALITLVFLYLALLASPLLSLFPNLFFRNLYLKSRRALGVSAFYFALLHALFAFFGQLGGFKGLFFLPNNYLTAISFSFLALIILFILAITSFDFVISKISFPKWKKLHRLIYLAGILILIHALMLGSHFSDSRSLVVITLNIGLIFLLFLESIRLDKFLKTKISSLPALGISSLLIFLFLGMFIYFYFAEAITQTTPINIHATHIQIAKDAQNNQSSLPNIPSLQGDKTKRYTTSFFAPEEISPNQKVDLKFKIYDASNGEEVKLFSKAYEKLMHLIIVNDDLTFFNHIHPEQTLDGFEIQTTFLQPGKYHLYIDYQPTGAIEQQQAFTLNVGKADVNNQPIVFDPTLSKNFDGLNVTLIKDQNLISNQISIGNQKLKFRILDSNGNQVTTLKPYLASFGHLVMINTKTFDYIHVHPTNLFPPKPDENGGPEVEFMPLGLYGPIKPGLYKVYAQFNPDDKLITTDFMVEIK